MPTAVVLQCSRYQHVLSVSYMPAQLHEYVLLVRVLDLVQLYGTAYMQLYMYSLSRPSYSCGRILRNGTGASTTAVVLDLAS